MKILRAERSDQRERRRSVVPEKFQISCLYVLRLRSTRRENFRKVVPMKHRTFNALLVFLLLSVTVLSAMTPVPAQAAASGPSDPVEVAAFMDGLMAAEMSANHVPGAVVAVVKDGKVLFSKGYGYADLETRTPVDPEKTLFRPGSVSKLFVWTSVMQLVEQGKLSLEADVNQYLDFKIPATYPEPITLKTLLTHTPGFEDKGKDLFKLKPED